jgi:hypothetical protein
MSSFKGISADFIDSKYEGGIKVFLESTEDVRIFSEHWFSDYQDKISFESAEEGGQNGGGGGNAVLRKVEEAENQRLKAYGIVDRDKLLGDANNQDIFWESDDDKFHAASPYGQNIHVLRRWEMENYLLKPEAFRAELGCRISNRLAPEITAGTLLNHEDDLIKLTALSTVLSNKSIAAPEEGYGRAKSGNDLHVELNNYLSPHNMTLESNEFLNDTDRISAFANNEEDPEMRWDKLSRILDGKRALYKFCSIFHREFNIGGFQFANEVKGCLANRIASKRELLDEELCTTIERFAKNS